MARIVESSKIVLADEFGTICSVNFPKHRQPTQQQREAIKKALSSAALDFGGAKKKKRSPVLQMLITLD